MPEPATITDCPECDGCGEVCHPHWGSPTCPEPWITCPACAGSGIAGARSRAVTDLDLEAIKAQHPAGEQHECPRCMEYACDGPQCDTAALVAKVEHLQVQVDALLRDGERLTRWLLAADAACEAAETLLPSTHRRLWEDDELRLGAALDAWEQLKSLHPEEQSDE